MGTERAKLEAVISDFGGVLTSPLMDAFLSVQDDTGVSMAQFGAAMRKLLEMDGRHPLFELECGRISEADFLRKLEAAIESTLGRKVPLHGFRNTYFDALHPNETMIGLMRKLKKSGYRLALLTNNVKEWEPHWRAKLPVDEIFEVIVDSAFVGMRKPDHEIYKLTLDRLGGVDARACLFIDDVEVNCDTAKEIGMEVVHFKDTEQAVGEIEGALRSRLAQ